MKDFCLLYDNKKGSETTSKHYDSLTSLTIQTWNRFIYTFSIIYFMWYLWISLFQFLIGDNLNWCWTTDRNCYFKFNHLFWWNTLKPSISSHSKSRVRHHTRHLRCFVLEHSVFKTKHLRRLVQGFEWLEILGLCLWIYLKSELLKTIQIQINFFV